MKALTLTQPWAQLVIDGRKRFETRGWYCGFHGPLAIHAAKGMPSEARDAAIEFGYDPDALPRGVVLGTVDMAGCEQTVRTVTDPDITEAELSYGDYSPGRFAFRLSNPLPLSEPIPARGMLGLWDWEPGA